MIFTLKALSPITHAGFEDGGSTGNINNFRRVPVICNGNVEEIPCISGNAFRALIRRGLARELFDGLKLTERIKAHPAVINKLYAVIGNGGTISKNMQVTVNTDKIREIRADIPMLSLLGSAAYTVMINGMVNIGFARLDCKENGLSDLTIDEQLTEIGLVRHVDNEYVDKLTAEIKPMPYVTEAVIEGAIFRGSISLEPQATEIERSCLAHGIKLIRHVGGKSSVGFGMIEISTDEELDDSLYLGWLADKKNDDEHVKKLVQFAKEVLS